MKTKTLWNLTSPDLYESEWRKRNQNANWISDKNWL